MRPSAPARVACRRSTADWVRQFYRRHPAGPVEGDLCLDERLLAAEPAVEMALRRCRIGPQQPVCRVARLLDQRDVALEVREAQQRHAGLTRTQEFAGAADQQVLPRDLEAVGRLVEHLQALLRRIGQRLLEQQYAGALRGAAPDAPAQLMQLREP